MLQDLYIRRIATRLQRTKEKVEAAKAQPAQQSQQAQQAQQAQYLRPTPSPPPMPQHAQHAQYLRPTPSPPPMPQQQQQQQPHVQHGQYQQQQHPAHQHASYQQHSQQNQYRHQQPTQTQHRAYLHQDNFSQPGMQRVMVCCFLGRMPCGFEGLKDKDDLCMIRIRYIQIVLAITGTQFACSQPIAVLMDASANGAAS